MNMKLFLALALVAALIPFKPAQSADAKPVSISRQVSRCMLVRMRADHTESYLAALKVCREQLDPQRDERAAALNTPTPKSGT
jgi:hypothetical protein